MAQHYARPGGSAIYDPTTRAIPLAKESGSESKNVSGWAKTIALKRKERRRRVCTVHWLFTSTCAAYDLVRMRNLAPAGPACKSRL